MSTNNPKVAGYIPQHLYDSFVKFCEEKNVSVSKGIALVFAGYFGVDYSVNYPVDNNKLNELSLRLQSLEEKYSGLPSDLSGGLLSKIDVLSTQLEALTHRVQSLEKSGLYSNSFSELPSILPNAKVDLNSVLPSDSLSSLESELSVGSSLQGKENPVQLTLLSDSLSGSESELPDETHLAIPGHKLSKLRFSLSPDTVSGVKRKYRSDSAKFTDWTQTKDPDRIGWAYSEKLKGYVPVGELTSEQKVNYLKWRAENILDA